MGRKISGIVNIVISVFLLVGLKTVFRPCPKPEMACNHTAKAAMLLLGVILIAGILKLFLKHVEGELPLNIVIAVTSIELIFIPKIIGTCQMASMSCNTKTTPAIYISAAVSLLLAVAFSVTELAGRKE